MARQCARGEPESPSFPWTSPPPSTRASIPTRLASRMMGRIFEAWIAEGEPSRRCGGEHRFPTLCEARFGRRPGGNGGKGAGRLAWVRL